MALNTQIHNADFAHQFHIIAGPCSVESKEQFWQLAEQLHNMGVQLLRGGIFKLRTRPNTFQGHGEIAYSWAQEVKSHFNMGFISEVTDPRQISDMAEVVDCFQVGARNMYNYPLLSELGKVKKPVLLKRAFSATIDEWLFAADYILKEDNEQIFLCERGIRSFETRTRNTLDLNAIAYIKKFGGPFPVIADPSHGTGRSDLVTEMSLACIAAGADGLLVEVHENPDQALSDKEQAMNLTDFKDLFEKSHRLAQFMRDLKA
ncbi:MAG: 3-deoxy-7-phosphoheptulonate synthase [Bdellovibrionaceae bacterium]|nr:3-deoxy-7-phosphoheptulonate synthase [Pseudobdellovibrionaceae bacterium]